MDHGRLTVGGRVYPFAEVPLFDLDLEARDVALPQFNPLFQSHLGTHVRAGTLDAVAEIAADSNEIKGYVKPVLDKLALGWTYYDGWLPSIKAKLIRGITRLLKNKDVDRIATKITFDGVWGHPQVNILQTLGQFLKNAFQVAFRPTLEHSIHFARAGATGAVLTLDYNKRPRSTWQKISALMKEAATRWSDDNAMRLSASLSYYATFSLAPLLILVIAIAGLAFGRDAAQGRIVDELSGLMGAKSAETVQGMIQAAWRPAKGLVASVVSIMTLIFGAVGVLLELKQSLNLIWRSPVTSSFRTLVTDRLRSLGLILGVGFLMLISLIVSAVIAAVGQLVGDILPMSQFVMNSLNLLLSFAIFLGLLAMIYKWLPDTYVAWRDVWIGAGVTSVLFSIGKQIFGIYLGKSSVSSAYGAAGAVVIVLLWVYFSSMILYYGAEFTALYAEKYGSRRSGTSV